MKLIRYLAITMALFFAGTAHSQNFQSLGTASLSVTVTSGSVALPAGNFGNNVTVQNIGSNEAFVAFGGSSIAATTSSESVQPNSARCFSTPNTAFVAAITASSTTTLRISQGSGPCSISYRGGTTIAIGSITGLGTGVATALGVNIGSAGAPVLFNGAGGMPSSLVGTNIIGTAAGLTAGRVTTNANLTGDVTSVGNATTLAWITRTASQTLAIGAGGTLGSNAFTSTAYLSLTGGTLTGAQIINLNSAAAPIGISGFGLQVVGADSTIGRVQINSFNAIASVTTARANGTAAAPTAVVSGDQIGGLNAYSYVTSASPGYVGPVASFQTYATQNHTTTAMGSKLVLATIPNGSTTLTTGLTVDQNQQVQINSSGSVSNTALSFNNGSGYGFYLPFNDTISIAANGAQVMSWDATNGTILYKNLRGTNGSSYSLSASAASATAPTIIPNLSAATTGVGAQASGNISMVVGGAENTRFVSGGFQTAGYAMIGSTTALILTSGALGMQKIIASASAPGAAGAKFELVCGTNAGTAKLTIGAGTSATMIAVIDNIGAGVTGC